ncbi:MAG: YceI family protein [Candidatus Thiothrix singaporensis]|uniref:YceI family protein n=1 Tax=Candidatus Thiothrix singaporensis TaxID=2799669 RepID=A0A7L6AUF6_9GAMM|nr:MAG: YceI family protein [Candidatus Thiothrix singaporensis]
MHKLLKHATGTALAFALLSGPAYADWVLDNNKSALYFVSIKKENIAEPHTFKKLSGSITAAGQGTLSIDLGSVETNIDIRNIRMRDHLFETNTFPTATVSVDLTKTGVKPGIQPITVTLDLHGVKKEIPALVALTDVGDTVQVSTVAPIILDAAAFDLANGLTTLREIGAVSSISNAVPVTFFLSFVKQN